MEKKFKRPENTNTINRDSRAIAKYLGYSKEFIRCGECGGSGHEWINYSVGTVRCEICKGCGYFISKDDYDKYVKPNKSKYLVKWNLKWIPKERRHIDTPEIIIMECLRCGQKFNDLYEKEMHWCKDIMHNNLKHTNKRFAEVKK